MPLSVEFVSVLISQGRVSLRSVCWSGVFCAALWKREVELELGGGVVREGGTGVVWSHGASCGVVR